MEIKELAQLLDGRQVGDEITEKECIMAHDSDLVVVFGYSDDNMEFRGAIYDEIAAYEGGTAYIYDGELLKNECDSEDNCPYFKKLIKNKNTVEIVAIWNGGMMPCWSYQIPIDYEEFMIYEDGEPYCRGIVFSRDDTRIYG